MTHRITMKVLHDWLGITPSTPGYGTTFGARSKAALFAKLSNRRAPAITAADIKRVAADLGVSEAIIRAVRAVEAPRGAFDDDGRPSILFERHKFRAHTQPAGRFDKTHSALSGGPYGPGGYGKFSAQYEKLAAACALDPEAAFSACSWGAFQVLGENARALDYESPLHMAESLTVSEAAHLDCFARFVRTNRLQDELQACRPGQPESCVPFVSRYNGPGFRQFSYHTKLARAALA